MNRKLYSAALAFGLATAAGLVATSPADAASSDTTVTFALTNGGLAITAPGSKDLGSVATNAGLVQGQLGTVTVNDSRGMVAAAWSVTVSTTDFTTTGSTATVPATNVTYTPGVPNATGAVPVPAAGALNAPLPVMTATGVGNNSVSWNPTISVVLPPTGLVTGTYTAKMTHSVS